MAKPNFADHTIVDAAWVIVENGLISKIFDSEGKEFKQRCTVKDSRKLIVSDSMNDLNRLDIALYVNIAESEEQMNERREKQKQDEAARETIKLLD